MSKSRTAANTTAAPTVDIPKLALHPDVARAGQRRDAIAAELAAVRRAREAIEQELGAGPNVPDFEIEGRLIAEGAPTAPVAELRDHRHREKALAHALGLVAADLKAATEQAARQLTAETREAVYLPAARKAVAAWLVASQAADEFRHLVDRLQATGVGSGTYSPFNDRVPLGLGDHSGFVAFAQELIKDGLADREQVAAAFPGVV